MTDRQPLTALEGRVVVGNRIGASLGVPTANIAYTPSDRTLPDGVYVADILLLDQGGQVYQGVLNQGTHPTVPHGRPAVEIHLFDFRGLLYDQCVRIRYWHFLRPEIFYASKEALRVQMQQDILNAKAWFLKNPDYLTK